MSIREGKFYSIWPNIEGKGINLQWGEVRNNTSELKGIVRNSWQELEEGVDELNSLKQLVGFNFGETSFRNKYRLFYDKTTEQFSAYRNTGTVDSPVWEEVWQIRFSDGQFQVVSEGGIQSNAGFYGPIPRQLEVIGEVAGATEFINPAKLFFNSEHGFYLTELKSGSHKGAPVVNYAFPFGRSKTYTASGKEWIIAHQFGVSPVLVQTMDDHDRVVIPDQIDVSDPNTAYFYFHASTTGKAIIATGGTGAVELVPRDPFYLVVRTTTENAADKKMNPNAELIFDDADFYVKVNLDSPGGTRKRANVAFKRDTRVEFTDGTNVNLSSKLSFNENHFYISTDSEGDPIVNLANVRSIPFHIETAEVKNYFLDPVAVYPYVVENVNILTSSGSAIIGFYIKQENEGGDGISIVGLDPISVSSLRTKAISTSNNEVNVGDELIMSVPSNSSAVDLRGTVAIRLN